MKNDWCPPSLLPSHPEISDREGGEEREKKVFFPVQQLMQKRRLVRRKS